MSFLDQIVNHNWPSFDSPEHLNELDEIASDAFNKHTIEGYLAALLIYHQLCEEMINLLVEDSKFFIKAAIYPAEINFSAKDKIMFGRALQDLRESIEFGGKKEFVEKCTELNRIRNGIVHNLTKKTSLDDVKRSLQKVQKLYESIFTIFDAEHDEFCVAFKDFRKDKFTEYLDI
jgi:hypothetical protein